MPKSYPPYPQFELEYATELVRIVRGRAVREELPLFLKLFYLLLGNALGAAQGEPDGELMAAADGATLEDLTAARDELQALAAADVGEFGLAADDAEAIDPATLMLIIQLATKLIEAWINRKRG